MRVTDRTREANEAMRELFEEEIKHVSGGGNAFGTDGTAPANGVRDSGKYTVDVNGFPVDVGPGNGNDSPLFRIKKIP